MFLNYKKLTAGCMFLAAAALVACDKEAEPIMTTKPGTDGAYVKVLHAAPSFRSVFNAKDSFHLYLGSEKVNGPQVTYGNAFPSRTANGYAQVPAGTAAVKLFAPGTEQTDFAEVFSMEQTLQQGKYYSLIVTDSIKNGNDSTRIWLEDNVTLPDPNQVHLRFVHAVMNDTADKLVDIYSARRNGIIFAGYKPGQASNFTSFAYNGLVSDTLIVRRTGTGQELARLNAITFGHQRVYTVVYRGDAGVTGTAAKARTLTYYLNR